MNRDQAERYRSFFDDNFVHVARDLLARNSDGGLQQARSAFATAYRFWDRIEDDGDPLGWVYADVDRQRRPRRHRRAGDRPVDPLVFAPEHLDEERRRAISVGRRRRVVSTAALSVMAAAFVAVELLIAKG
jgi:hypothetical protein